MLSLFIAIFCSVAVSVFLKIARSQQIVISQAIACNYIMASSLTYFVLQPDFQGLSFSDALRQNEHSWIFLLLGLLLPSIFLVMAKAIEHNGIARADAAQRLSLFLPILAAFLLFGEPLTSQKDIAILLAFLALFALIFKHKADGASGGIVGFVLLLLVWFGYGVIDILFKQIAKFGVAFPFALFTSFIVAGCFIFAYLIFAKIRWQAKSMLAGLLLGVLNFLNILFYIKAHQQLSQNPSLVFAGMNIGVIILGALIGLFVFKEKLNKINFMGIVLGIVAIILLLSFK
ncbi:EamA/RhaT family transporter [Gallibacterium anatis]|uniref:EamA family transporter n=1 Tax=Gallibacterium anatis TaxID=750 RepID=UPI000531EBD2|nr:membrane protein [Gallibacterium anatis]KGQ64932.1 membrane protein [Gallibacterium anatis 7990]WIM85097.1 EamA/RhaT family transporter [Gallibacterium anatis]